MTDPKDPRHLRAELTIAAVSFVWGSTFVAVKGALEDVSTLLFIALRFVLAAALMGFFFQRTLFRRESWRGNAGAAGVITGFLLFLGYALQTAGLRYTTASKSAFITGLYIVVVPLIVSCVKRSRPRPLEWAGVGLAFGGTALLTSGSGTFHLNGGDILTVGCAVAFAAHMVAVEHFTQRLNYKLLSILQVGAVGVFAALTFGWAEKPFLVATPRLIMALAITAVFATAISFALYTWAQGHTTATRAALIFSLEPVFAGLVAWIWAGEAWTGRALFGAALILAGIMAVELKPRPETQHPSH